MYCKFLYMLELHMEIIWAVCKKTFLYDVLTVIWIHSLASLAITKHFTIVFENSLSQTSTDCLFKSGSIFAIEVWSALKGVSEP
jgi:hypothetical protein